MSGKKMKFWSIYGGVLLVCFIASWIIGFFAVEGSSLAETVKIATAIFLVLIMVPLIIWVGIAIVKYFAGSIANIHSSGDSLFAELDNYHRHWGETKEHYNDMINVIHFYYKEGKVDSVIGKDLCKLYKRKEFLERAIGTKEYLCMCLTSVGFSICATLFLEYMRSGDTYPIWYGMLGVLLFFAVVLIKYSEMFNEGSNQIYQYELKLLNEKIEDAENSLLIKYKKEDMMLTKQNVLNTLMDKCKVLFGKKYDDITNDIRIIEQINLNVEEGVDYKEIKFLIGKTKREGILYLDNNNKLINEDYETLYKILRKYDLIYKIESVENSGEDMIS